MDKYQDVRSIPLRSVLVQLGYTELESAVENRSGMDAVLSTTQRKTKPRSRLTSGGLTAFLAANTAQVQSTL